ncbi:ligase-associated DNA damage response endonuclease PdeM [Ulvibacterium sp.]|uniref:ligase-associated DNA damage response endonuclease PdeM n=1 Tax=Ulvibacterium sp. TaxID=2665914 RepID=UPI003CC58B14
MNGHRIQIQNQNFILHPSGTLFWQDRSVLLISDVHLGKVSHFRKFGAAVPQNVVQKNFELMDEALEYFNPKVICFLGDLFHSALNKEWNFFERWIAKKSMEVILVAGNHDIISPLKYEDLGIKVVSEVQWDDFLLTHHPEERNGFFNFSGHIHPAVRLRGKGRQSLRLPCFFKSDRQLILPAFGLFTGTFVLEPKKTDEVFAIVEDEIMKL